VIDKEFGDDVLSRRLVKFVVLVLGAGPAIRDATLVLLTQPPLI